MKLTDAALAAAKAQWGGPDIVLPWLDGSPIGLNEACRCGSDRTFRECCVAFIASPPSPIEHGVGSYLGTKDLWPQDTVDPVDVISRLLAFGPHDLVQTLSRISIRLQDDHLTVKSEVELAVLRDIMPRVWYTKAERWLLSGKRTKVLHRLVFPAMIMQVLGRADEARSEITVKGNEHLIGPLITDFNQIIENDYQDLKARADSADGEMRVLYASLYRQAFHSEAEDYPGALGRIWCLIDKGLPAAAAREKAFDFKAAFLQTFKFSVEDMLAYGFVVRTQYSRDNTDLFQDPNKFIMTRTSLRTVVPEQLLPVSEKIFDYVALPWDQHTTAASKRIDKTSTGNMYQLSTLHDHPVVEMPNGIIFALDGPKLRLRVTEGAYWALFNILAKTDEHEALRDAFGHATEWYAAELLRNSLTEAMRPNLWLDWDGAIRGKGKKPDAVIREDDTLYFIEVTTSSVRVAEASSGDPNILGDALKRVWFGAKKGDSAKVTQLVKSIDAFRARELLIDGVDPNEIRRIRPVLVSLRDLPQWPVLMDWYRALLREGGMTEQFIADIVFLDMEELEELSFCKLNGESWTSILAQKRLGAHPDISMHNFLFYTDRTREHHPFVYQTILDAAATFKARTVDE